MANDVLQAEQRWQDADRDIWRYDTRRGRRITFRANAEYLNVLEVQAQQAEALAQALRELEQEALIIGASGMVKRIRETLTAYEAARKQS